MKKFLSLLIAMMMVLSVMGGAFAETVDVDAIEDTMTSADGVYEIAFVTDVGQLKDKSFNQGTWNGVKQYAYEKGLSYKYYQPANGDQATDDDRYDAMKAAAESGAKIIVCAGYLQGTAMAKAAEEFTDVKFVFIDGWALADSKGEIMNNVAAIVFKEEQCGFLAGYAAVSEGYTKLGFCGGGGGTNPACCRYGYGFVQGAQAAAEAKGVNVEMNYTWLYGANFTASPEMQTMTNGWYENGTEVIFPCGGQIALSVFAAAAENDCYTIGVDSDQSYDSETVITSAMKGVGEAAYSSIAALYDGNWDTIGGQTISMGAAENAVGLPVDTWSLQNYTVEQYEADLQAIIDGTIAIDDDYANLSDDAFANVTLNVIE